MFGGAGLFADGLMFGLVYDGTIYLKADETNVAEFEREGSGPVTYMRGKSTGHATRHALPYWQVPERLYDDPEELAAWAARSFAIAEHKKTAPKKRKKSERRKSKPKNRKPRKSKTRAKK